MQFEEMSNEQKAVAIAKDVIKHLNELDVKEGNYVCGKFAVPDEFEDNSQLQQILEQLAPTCTVCALGACFLSHVRLFNEVTLEESGNSVTNHLGQRKSYINFGVDQEDAKEPLMAYFVDDDLCLIEAAFERDSFHGEHVDDDYAVAAVRFGRRYEDSRERLRAIMENVIEHNGRFVLPDELVQEARGVLSGELDDDDE